MAIEVLCEKRITNEPVPRDADAVQRREYVLLTCLAGMFVLGLMFYGWQQWTYLQAGYDIESAQKNRAELAEIRKQLQMERDSLADPQRIDRIARKQLGMTVPAPGQTVILAADAPLTIPVVSEPLPPALTASKR